MRLLLGDVPVVIDAEMLAQLADQQISDMLDHVLGENPLMRSSIKAMIAMKFLPQLRKDAGASGLPAPDPKPGEDLIRYTLRYILSCLLLGLESTAWQLFIEMEGTGDVQVTGVAPAVAGNGISIPAPAGSARDIGTTDERDSGITRGPLGHSRHDGYRENDVRAEVDTAFETDVPARAGVCARQ